MRSVVFFRPSVFVLWLIVACLVGCDTDVPANSAADAVSLADLADLAAPTVQTMAAAPVVELGHFVGSWDPLTEAFTLALEEPAGGAVTLRDVPQALYCERRITSGRPDTFGLNTLPGTLGFTPTECGLLDEFPYSATGTFCATIAVTSYFGDRVDAVYAEITSVVPDTGYNGYAHPFGTGADPSTVVAGANQPSSAGGGLWAYGALEPGETVSVPWVLQYEPGPFRFSGRIVAAVPERMNGIDDNCDGVVDEAPYADGEACTDATECFGGYCDESTGTCVSSCPSATWGPSCTACNCDDGLFCNGEETCDSELGCQAGVAPLVDDGVACTVDTCDESSDTVENAPSNALCDDSNACTADSCDVFGGCISVNVATGTACTGCVGGGCVCDAGSCVSGVPAGFVRIEAGTFTMGSPSGELGRFSNEAQHSVTLTRAFYLQATEVTQEQWQSLMGNNPSNRGGCPTCPVERVNWWEAVAYANALSASEGLPACYTLTGCGAVTPGNDMECSGVTVTAAGGDPYACTGYRLPTESEWEYAARAGTTTATYAGNLTATDCSDTTLLPIAWFCGNSGNQTQPVGGKVANAWGLYDMLGNVWEWTWDRYATYPSTATDPTGATGGSDRVGRGGSRGYNALGTRAADRGSSTPGGRFSDLGFRPARTAP